METALSEISLVFFTSVAPAGAFGYALMGLYMLTEKDRDSVISAGRRLVVPLSLAIVGLIASATHLGTPANALYVISGIGRSPLSNEVLAAVLFLALGGSFWMFTFKDGGFGAIEKAWLSCSIAASLVFVLFISLAYSVQTIPTWNAPIAPVTLWFNGLSGGPLVAYLGIRSSRRGFEGMSPKLFGYVSMAFATINVGALLAEGRFLYGIATTVSSMAQQVPWFDVSTALFALMHVLALLCLYKASAFEGTPGIAFAGMAVAFSLVGCFVSRFAFYSSYMTIGM